MRSVPNVVMPHETAVARKPSAAKAWQNVLQPPAMCGAVVEAVEVVEPVAVQAQGQMATGSRGWAQRMMHEPQRQRNAARGRMTGAGMSCVLAVPPASVRRGAPESAVQRVALNSRVSAST